MASSLPCIETLTRHRLLHHQLRILLVSLAVLVQNISGLLLRFSCFLYCTGYFTDDHHPHDLQISGDQFRQNSSTTIDRDSLHYFGDPGVIMDLQPLAGIEYIILEEIMCQQFLVVLFFFSFKLMAFEPFY